MHLKTKLAAVTAGIFIFGGAVPPLNAAPPDDPCSLLTLAQVKAVLGFEVSATHHDSQQYLKTCLWAEPGAPMMGHKSVTVVLETADAFNAWRTRLDQLNTMAKGKIVWTPISGIGDDAFYRTSSAGVCNLEVRKGDVAFNITLYGAFPNDQAKSMEKTLALEILSKL